MRRWPLRQIGTYQGFLFLLLLGFLGGCSEEGVGLTEEKDGNVGEVDVDTGESDVVSDAEGGEPDVGGGETPISCKDGSACDDGDPCTTQDSCGEGSCTGISYSCDDGVTCTLDLCDGAGGCSNPLKGGVCRIEGTCYADGEIHPDAPCLACVAPVAEDAWSADDTLSCDDGDPCTVAEGCKGGACIGGFAVTCDDGNGCTDDECVAGEGCASTPNNAPCEDGNPCSLGDACSEGGCLGGGEAMPCTDGKPCTDDTCAGGIGCVFVPNEAPCEDGNPCTLRDKCAEGECGGGAGVLLCDDGNHCTTEGCDALLGCTYLPNEAGCEDGNACTLEDVCSGGSCTAGLGSLVCNDGNVCTSDGCDPQTGCVVFPNSEACDDGNACTTNDTCADKFCLGGSPLTCQDGNPCTDNLCSSEVGCVYVANELPCEDSNPCTDDDTCTAGVCGGDFVACDDGNDCTLDTCDPQSGACVFNAITSYACLPQVEIFSPARGISIQGPVDVVVTGSATSAAGPFTVFTVNGVPTSVAPDGAFSHTVTPVHGMNLIIVEAADVIGGTAKRVQSFYYSTEWTPIDITDPQGSYIQEGIALWLGQSVVDDGVHDFNDIDDLATIFELVAGDLDFSSMFSPTEPVATENIPILGDVDIYIKSLALEPASVSLLCIDGGLHMTLVIEGATASGSGLTADLEFKYQFWGTQTATGQATATSIVVDADLFLSVDVSTGEVIVNMGDTEVEINNLNVSLDGVVGLLTNWIVNFFEDDFAQDFETTFEDQLESIIPGIVAGALESLAFNSDFEFPPLLGGTKTVSVSLLTSLFQLDFQVPGGELGLFATAVAEKDQNYDTLGSIGRAWCLTGEAEWLDFDVDVPLQIALHDDLFNQLLYNIWWGGGLAFELDESALEGVDVSAFGISDLAMDVSFLLPPIITSCNPTDTLRVQIGDLLIQATLTLGLIDLEMDVYTSFAAEATFDVVETVNGQELGLALSSVSTLETDIIFADEALVGFKDVIAGLIEAQLVPTFLSALSGGAIGGFPLPAIDLSIVDGVPPGTALELDLDEVIRTDGYTVLMGDVK